MRMDRELFQSYMKAFQAEKPARTPILGAGGEIMGFKATLIMIDDPWVVQEDDLLLLLLPEVS